MLSIHNTKKNIAGQKRVMAVVIFHLDLDTHHYTHTSHTTHYTVEAGSINNAMGNILGLIY